MEEYLARGGLPHYLYPASTIYLYQNINLSDQKQYNDTNFKYHQYFSNLDNTINTASDKPNFYPDDTFPYYKSHHVYRAITSSDRRSHQTNTEQLQNFDSFIHVPTVFSDEPMTSSSYHTVIDMPDGIYIFGGLSAMQTDEYEQMLQQLTKNYTIPPENFTMICDYDMPLPIDKEKIESMSLKPAKSIRKYMTESKSFRWVCDLNYDYGKERKRRASNDHMDGSVEGNSNDTNSENENDSSLDVRSKHGFQQDYHIDSAMASRTNSETGVPCEPVTSANKVLFVDDSAYYYDVFSESDFEGSDNEIPINLKNWKSNTPKSSRSHSVNDEYTSSPDSDRDMYSRPKSLVGSSATKLSDRIFLVYGGLEIHTHISYPDDMHCVIKKSLIPSDKLWVFDTITYKFQRVDINIHPTYSSIFPSTIPRFGHSMVSVPLEDVRKSKYGSTTELANPKDVFSSKTSGASSSIGSADAKKFAKFSNDSKTPAIFFVMGGYKLSDNGESFIAMNDLWKCEFFFSGSSTNHHVVVASPVGDFSLVNGQFSYIINDKGEQLPNNAESPTFTGVFKHNGEGVNWPGPRGFFTLSLVDRDVFGHYFNWRKLDEVFENANQSQTFAEEKDQLYHSPRPVRRLNSNFGSNLDFRFNKSSPVSLKQSQTNGSSSTNTATTQSSSPFLETKLHTQEIEVLKPKILIAFGGSSIEYTKVMSSNDDGVNPGVFDVFYNRSILCDAWIYDFQTEKWYEIEKLMTEPSRLFICGHTIHYSDSAINVVGGVEKIQYDSEVYNSKQGGIFPYDNSEKYTQIVGWKKGELACQNFHDKRNIAHPLVKGVRGYDLSLGEFRNFYSSFEFSPRYGEWRLAKMFVVYELEYYEPWQESENFEKLFGGGVYYERSKDGRNNSTSTEDGVKDILNYRKKINKNIAFSNGPTVFKDNKIILFSPDIKLLDLNTNKYLPGQQTVIGNGVSELYSTSY